jgi:hypothetical protein
MAKKGGKNKKKGGAKPAAVAAVDKVADAAKSVVQPGHETEDKVMYGEGKTESAEQTQAPTESKIDETPVAPVTETKEAEKQAEAAPVVEKENIQETVNKAQASKAGTVGELDGGDKEGKTVLPESSVKETSLGAEVYPSTTEASAEESATSTAAITGVPVTTSLPERPKTETTAPVAVPAEIDAAHPKRPYEKPIFSNDEVKPHKMPKTHEEQVAEQNLVGAGPASTAAYTTPEPIPAVEAPKMAEETVATETAPKTTAAEIVPLTTAAESKPVESLVPETVPKTTAAESKPVESLAPETTPKTTVAESKPLERPVESKTIDTKAAENKADTKAPGSPVAVAAASAAMNNSKTDKAATESAEPKKPEAALKRGEEPQARTDAPKETLAKETPSTESAQQEPAKADEPKTSETAEQAEKKKGGFFGWLKRKFK